VDQVPGRGGSSGAGAGDGEWARADGHLGEPAGAVSHADAGDRGQTGLEGDDLRLLTLLAGGLPANAVARKMNLSPRTLRRRTRAVCDKIGEHTPIEAVAWAARRLLI
jgi:DNA-binding NarL/FixJ family response regulator